MLFICLSFLLLTTVTSLQVKCEVDLSSDDPYHDSIQWVMKKIESLTGQPAPERLQRDFPSPLFKISPQFKLSMSQEYIIKDHKRKLFKKKVRILNRLAEATKKRHIDAYYMNKAFGRKIALISAEEVPLTGDFIRKLSGKQRAALHGHVGKLFRELDNVGGYYAGVRITDLIMINDDPNTAYFPVLEFMQPKSSKLMRKSLNSCDGFISLERGELARICPQILLKDFIRRSELWVSDHLRISHARYKLPSEFQNFYEKLPYRDKSFKEVISMMTNLDLRESSSDSHRLLHK